MVIGAPPYMSPEAFMAKELTPQADIYALALVTYEMLSGRSPFEASTPWEWAGAHMKSPPRPLDHVAPGVAPAAAQAVLEKALAKQPADRHASVAEFVAQLLAAR